MRKWTIKRLTDRLFAHERQAARLRFALFAHAAAGDPLQEELLRQQRANACCKEMVVSTLINQINRGIK